MYARRFLATATTTSRPVSLAKQVESAPKLISQTTQVGGVKIATVDHRGPGSRLQFVVNAGTRNESLDTHGISQFWKQLLVRTTERESIAKTVRESELRGDSLFTFATREQIGLGSEFLRDNLVDVVPTLARNFFNRNIEVYEFLDAKEKLKEESAAWLADPCVVLSENLHRAAFRSGLGNPLYSQHLDELKRSDLIEFADKFFGQLSIVGYGVDHEDLVSLVQSGLKEDFSLLSSSAKETSAVPQKYFGGDQVRVDAGPGSVSRALLGFPSVGLKSASYPVSLVFASLLDGHSHLKWGSGSSGLLKAARHCPNCQAFTVLNSYSDASLFSVKVLSPESSKAKATLQNAVNVIKTVSKGTISSQDVTRAKNDALLKLDAVKYEDASLHHVSKEALVKGIHKVTGDDLCKFAKTMLGSKPTLSVHGPASMPYLDEIAL